MPWACSRGQSFSVSLLPLQSGPPAAAAAAASKPSAYQLPLSLLACRSYRGSCTHCFAHCFHCFHLSVWAVCSVCKQGGCHPPNNQFLPITFDFHFRHSLLEHNQPSRLFHPPSPGHITLHQPHYGSRARVHGCPEEGSKRRSMEQESV